MVTSEANTLAPILLVEDNDDDVTLARTALSRARVDNPIITVGSGSAAVDYLMGTGIFSNRAEYPMPCFILLDLKLPRMSGLELLGWLRTRGEFRRIHTVVLTSSARDEDIRQAYELGAHSFITKPSDFKNLVRLARASHTYWTRVAQSIPDSLN